MKTITANLLANIQSSMPSIAVLWKVTRKDTNVFGFSSIDRDIIYDGVTYKSAFGADISAIISKSDLTVSNSEFTSIIDESIIKISDINGGLWDYADVIVYAVNPLSIADGAIILQSGSLGNIYTVRDIFSAELRGLVQHLHQKNGRSHQAACDAVLGDVRCGVNLASFTITGAVTNITSSRQFQDLTLLQATGYFNEGLMTITSGDNAGYSMEIKTFTSPGIFLFHQPFPHNFIVGDAYSAIAGCDKLRATCKTKFANIPRFRGHPDIKGRDFMINGGIS